MDFSLSLAAAAAVAAAVAARTVFSLSLAAAVAAVAAVHLMAPAPSSWTAQSVLSTLRGKQNLTNTFSSIDLCALTVPRSSLPKMRTPTRILKTTGKLANPDRDALAEYPDPTVSDSFLVKYSRVRGTDFSFPNMPDSELKFQRVTLRFLNPFVCLIHN